MGGHIKFGCSGFAVLFVIMAGMPPIMKKMRLQTLKTQTSFCPPIGKISPNISVYKISPKSLVWVFFLIPEPLAEDVATISLAASGACP